jgi:hypothetical protein
VDDLQLFDAFGRRIWRTRGDLIAAHNIACNHLFAGAEIIAVLRAAAAKTTAPYPWQSGYIDQLFGVAVVPADTLQPGEWQLRDTTGTVMAFGTLDDLRQETA